MKNIIFVGGAPRSGTSLMQRILNSNSDIYGGPEFNRIIKIIELRNSFKNGIDNKQLESYFENVERVDIHFNELISNLFNHVLNKNSKNILSEKTPNNVLVFEELIQILPNAKFLFVIRNPFAIVNSMKEVKAKAIQNKMNIPDFVSSIRKSTQIINNFWEKGFKVYEKYPDRICLVKYEDLMNNTKAEVEKITSFLSVNFEEQMLKPNQQKFDYKIKEDTIWASNKVRSQEITNVNIDKWKNNLSKYEQYYISKKSFNFNVIADSYSQKLDFTWYIKIRYFISILIENFSENLIKLIFKKAKSSSLRKLV